jgi:hypothetical protein
MQDFPTLSHYLSLAHSPWTLIAVVILFSLTVTKILGGHLAQEVTRRIELTLSRIFRRGKGPGPSPPTTTKEFAKVLHEQLWEEFVRLDLDAPRPLAVGWKPVPLGGDHLDPALAGQDIATVYDKIESQRLVILGAAGSGKSVLVQHLAISLMGGKPSAEGHSYDGPIPVIFGLTSWEPGTGLNEWLAGQLVALRYKFAPSEAEVGKLLRNRRIVPILDGFDEIDPSLRAQFLELLNKESSNPLILTSRSDEYLDFGGSKAAADSNSSLLARAPAVELMPLSLEEICGYLLALPYRRGGLPAWQPVVDALKSPPKGQIRTVASLRQALSVPLMMAIARDIYKQGNPAKLLQEKFSTGGKPATGKKDPGRKTAEEYLLKKFVPAMYSSKQDKRPHWKPEQAQRAFSYLAAHLQDRQGPQRQGIAWWEFGGTDKKSAMKRAIFCGLAAGLVMMVANGTATFAAVRGAGGLGVTPRQGIVVVLGNSTAIAVAFGLVHWLAARRADWVIQPSWVGLSIPWLRGSRTVDNRDLAREFGSGFAGGSIGGGVAMLGLLLSSLLVSAIGGDPPAASVTTASPGWPATLLAVLGMTLIFGVTAGNVAVLQAPVEIESAGGPLELLAADRRLALGGGAVTGVLSGAAIGCVIGLEQGLVVGLGFAAVGCATVWLGGAISVTAWGQWLICGRLLLPLKGELPWRARAFLRDAHQRGVLRQSGAFYQFRHILLQELYAPAKGASPAQKAP